MVRVSINKNRDTARGCDFRHSPLFFAILQKPISEVVFNNLLRLLK